MTDDKLRDWSADHIHCELWMLEDSAIRLMTDPCLDADRLMKNALIEAVGTHARVVATFLYPEVGAVQPDDVTVDHYVSNPDRYRTARGTTISDVLKEARGRTNKEIAHQTLLRRAAGTEEKKWILGPSCGCSMRH